MDIGQRLRALREGRLFSQGDIEKRTGLLRCYISRVECGHTAPTLGTMEKWAKALDLELYQLFYQGKGTPAAPKVVEGPAPRTRARELVDLFGQMAERDKQLVLGLAREVVRRRGKRCYTGETLRIAAGPLALPSPFAPPNVHDG
jgi:transcriptional regulator with XRE-family HTH domain